MFIILNLAEYAVPIVWYFFPTMKQLKESQYALNRETRSSIQ